MYAACILMPLVFPTIDLICSKWKILIRVYSESQIRSSFRLYT